MSYSKKIEIDSLYLHTNVIKANALDKIRLDGSATMTIQADKCIISDPSKGKLKIDTQGNTQIFETRLSGSENVYAILSIVPNSGKLRQVDEGYTVSKAYIDNNAGHITSSKQGSHVEINGANEVSLNVQEQVELGNTSEVILDIGSISSQSGITSDAYVEYGVENGYYTMMNGAGTCPKTKDGWGYDSYVKNQVVKLNACDSQFCPYDVSITKGYNTTFKLA